MNEDILPDLNDQLVDRDNALEPMWAEWKRVTQNHALSSYLDQVQRLLQTHNTTLDVSTDGDPSYVPVDGCEQYRIWESKKIPHLEQLLHRAVGDDIISQRKPPEDRLASDAKPLCELPNGSCYLGKKGEIGETFKHKHISQNDTIRELYHIFEALQDSDSPVRQIYGLELKQSLDALTCHTSRSTLQLAPLNTASLSKNIQERGAACEESQCKLMQALESGDSSARWLQLGGLWPGMNRPMLLSTMRSTCDISFGPGIKRGSRIMGHTNHGFAALAAHRRRIV